MSKEVKITYNELMKELDQYRHTSYRSVTLTKQQAEFLKKCRETKNNQKAVSWNTMVELWHKLGWPKTTDSGMRYWYKVLMEGNAKII